MARESTFKFLVPVVIVLSVCLPFTICHDDDYLLYSLGRERRKDDHIQPELRLKRYVETAIPRLADSYTKKYQKGEDGFNHMDMLGNMAIKAQALIDPKIPESSAPEYIATHVSNTNQSSPASTVVKSSLGPINQATVNVTSVKRMGDSVVTAVTTSGKNVTSDHYKNSSPDQHLQLDLTEDFPAIITNRTLTKNNITLKKEDSHAYYNSTFIVGEATAKKFWIDLDNHPNTTVNEMLSGSHRRAATVKLSFDFPFYGHMVRNITIATGGFLYTGDYIHSWLAATQYIAPLMANFDTGMSDESKVKYRDNGTSFSVEWEKVMLQDKKEAGSFTFQTTLHNTGDIVFVYKNIPIPVEDITDVSHPVKVGLSDAYIIDRTVFFVRRKTIYEYHRVNFEKDVQNWTVIYLKALPTCLSMLDCNSCLNHKTFECKWCGAANRCSTGFDRHRQDWQWKQCDTMAIGPGQSCDAIPGPSSSKGSVTPVHPHDEHPGEAASSSTNERGSAVPRVATAVGHNSGDHEPSNSSYGHAGMMAFILLILTAAGASLWVLYAYRNPHTQSGQMLIKYRPSQWGLRRGEARYTAATIHM